MNANTVEPTLPPVHCQGFTVQALITVQAFHIDEECIDPSDVTGQDQARRRGAGSDGTTGHCECHGSHCC